MIGIEEFEGEKPPEELEKKKEGIIQWILKFFLKKKEEEDDLVAEEPFSHDELYREFFVADERTQSIEWESGESNTVLLENMSIRCWKLRPTVSGYEEFRITEPLFVVGKKKEAVDGFIGRDTISRIHSRLFLKNGRLFIL